MPFAFSSLSDIRDHGFDTVIDVRSDAEFAEDRILGAISLPVLSNEERAHVGTIYKQDSPFRARKIGAAIVARNAAAHIEGPLADKSGDWRPLVYCWRGGQRSGSFASILREIGWRADTVDGGYRSYRRLVASMLYDVPLGLRVILLDGNTGSGKTEVLARLPELGCQVIDLEGLANHRGSLLGGLGRQPSQKAFESGLAMSLAGLDPNRPLVMEAESSKIGRLLVPPQLFAAMRSAKRIEVAASIEARAKFLSLQYGKEADLLVGRVEQLKSIRGAEAVKHWQGLITEGALEEAARAIVEGHYDPAYAKSRATHGMPASVKVEADALDGPGLNDLARRVAEAISRV